MTCFYLIRHAEAEGNVYRRIHGQYDSLITPNGLLQIEALARRFADIPVDACYASDLYRTRKTAEAVYLPKKLPLLTDERLREVNLGRWEDVPFGYLERFETGKMWQFNHDEKNWSVEAGECWQDYTGRMLAALEELATRHENQTVAVFTHGCVLRGLQKRLTGLDRVPYCDNTAVSRLLVQDGSFTFDFMNDSSHLPQEISTFARQRWWRENGGRDYNMWFDEAGMSATAMLSDTSAGFITLREASGEVGYIDRLGMYEPYRGRSLGIQLLGYAVSRMRSSGKTALAARVPGGDEASLHFFLKNGFTVTQSDADGSTVQKTIAVPGR